MIAGLNGPPRGRADISKGLVVSNIGSAGSGGRNSFIQGLGLAFPWRFGQSSKVITVFRPNGALGGAGAPAKHQRQMDRPLPPDGALARWALALTHRATLTGRPPALAGSGSANPVVTGDHYIATSHTAEHTAALKNPLTPSDIHVAASCKVEPILIR